MTGFSELSLEELRLRATELETTISVLRGISGQQAAVKAVDEQLMQLEFRITDWEYTIALGDADLKLQKTKLKTAQETEASKKKALEGIEKQIEKKEQEKLKALIALQAATDDAERELSLLRQIEESIGSSNVPDEAQSKAKLAAARQALLATNNRKLHELAGLKAPNSQVKNKSSKVFGTPPVLNEPPMKELVAARDRREQAARATAKAVAVLEEPDEEDDAPPPPGSGKAGTSGHGQKKPLPATPVAAPPKKRKKKAAVSSDSDDDDDCIITAVRKRKA